MSAENTTFTAFRTAGKPTKRSSNPEVVSAFLMAAAASATVQRGTPSRAAIVLDDALLVPNEGADCVTFIDSTVDRTVHAHVRAAIEKGLLPKGVIAMPGRPAGSKNKPKAAPAAETAPDATPAPVVTAPESDAPIAAPVAPVESAPAAQ